jgi:flagellar assembly protein FliH
MSSRFFSAEDLLGVRPWQPGSIGATFAKRRTEERETKIDKEAEQARNIEAARLRARDEGYRDGYASGQAAAQQAAVTLTALAESARKGISEDEQKIAEDLLDLALDVARQIVRADIKVKRDDVLNVIREAMECLPQSTQSRQLILHPNDVDIVRSHVGDELTMGNWRLIEDHRIEPGGCRISAATCEIDATLATRWKRVLAAFGQQKSWIESEPQP